MKRTNQNGVTLIALIITIIVLIIIAGVSIATLTGDNGVLQQTNAARVTQIEGTAKEQVELGCSAIKLAIEEAVANDGSYAANQNADAIQNTLVDVLNKDKQGLDGDFKIYGNSASKNQATIKIIYEGQDYKNASNSEDAKIIYTISLEKKQIELINVNTNNEETIAINNLIKKENLRYGIRVSSGVESQSVRFMSTDIMEIKQNTKYIVNRDIQEINYYDSDKQYVMSENRSIFEIGDALTYSFITPSENEIAYAIITFVSTAFDDSTVYDKFALGMFLCEADVFVTNKVSEQISEMNTYLNTSLYSNGSMGYKENWRTIFINTENKRLFSIKNSSENKYNVNVFYYDKSRNLIAFEAAVGSEYISVEKYVECSFVGITIENVTSTDTLSIQYIDVPNEYSKLEGKKIVGYGDSMTAGTSTAQYTWLGKVANYFNMQQYNRGIGGTRVDEASTTAWVTLDGEYIGRESNGDVIPNGKEGIDYKTINSSMCNDERITTIPTDADIVIFFGGANGMDEESYRTTLTKIKNRAANCKIICVNLPYHNTKNNDDTYVSYRQSITKISGEYNYPVIELLDLMGVNSSNAAYYMLDSVHWNANGNDLIAKYIIETIKNCIDNNYI